jgi:hypothetical protein
VETHREELGVEPRQLGRRARVLLAGGLAFTLGMVVFAGSQRTACSPTGAGLPVPPRLLTDDPQVRGLHFAALDRARTRGDVAPENVLPSDVRLTTRRVGDSEGFTVYLADGPGFACLGVDGSRAHYNTAKQCLLDVTIANQGLFVSIDAEGAATSVQAVSEDGIMVVAVPDHARLLTSASTEHVADYTSVVVLRPRQSEVLVQLLGRPPVSVNGPTSTTSGAARTC